MGRWIPYAHVLGGAARISGPFENPLTLGWSVKGGIGVDYVLPVLHGMLAIKPVETDFEYDQVNYGPLSLPAAALGGLANITVAKVSSGLVLRLGAGESAKGHNDLMLACEVTPGSVYPGAPVQISANPMNLKTKTKTLYMFSSTGGRVTQADMGATIATEGLAPGEYTIKGAVSEGSRASEQAKCEGTFTVKPFEPPTVTCSASPSTVQSGGLVAIVAVGASSANRPLTYSFSADAGTITGDGYKVQLATAGVSRPVINVFCNAVDDLGRSATATTQVAVMATAKATAPPPLPEASPLCIISLDRDPRRPVRIDNEAKACLDDIALNLERQNDAKLVLIGNFSPTEAERQGAQRSLNAKQYLTEEKGIEAGRIDTRLGSGTGRSVDSLLVPPGASLDRFKGRSFDPNSVQRIGEPYSKPAARHQGAIHRARTHRRSVAAPAELTRQQF